MSLPTADNIKSGQAVAVANLSKSFRVTKRKPGFAAALNALFHRHYEEIHAVQNISLTIKTGELVGFLGPNGAGKTTTLKMLSGLLHPTSGHVEALGFMPQKRDKKFLRSITLIMGNRSQLWWEVPIEDSFLLNKEIYEISDKDYRLNLNELVELLEIGDLLGLPAKKLSLGQRMKAEFAAALLHRPKLLLLDEPTLGLDVLMQNKIRQFLMAYNRRHQATILLTSHNMDDVQELCQRVILIDHGGIIYDGSLNKLTQRYAPLKTITIEFSQPPSPAGVKHFDLKPKEGLSHLFTLPVEREQVTHQAARLLSSAPSALPAIVDLSIEEPQLEEVIRRIFKKT